jgi:hypothetical protein
MPDEFDDPEECLDDPEFDLGMSHDRTSPRRKERKEMKTRLAFFAAWREKDT